MDRAWWCFIKGCGILVVLTLFLVTMAVILKLAMPAGDSLGDIFSSLKNTTVLGNRQVHGAVIPLTPGGDGQAADLLIENWRLDAPLLEMAEQTGRRVIPIYLSVTSAEDGNRQVQWETEVGTSDNSLAHNATFDRSHVYVSAGIRLLALARETGDVLWETTLSDLVETGCQDCIQVVDGRLVVLSTDQELHGLDTSTGELIWQVRLNDDAALSSSSGLAGFSVVGGQILVADGIESDSPTREARFYNPIDGTVTRRLRPACSDPDEFFRDEELGRSDPILVGPAGERITFFIESILFASCVQSWDVASGELLWETRLPDETLLNLDVPPGLLNSLSGPFFVMGADSLYLPLFSSASTNSSAFRIDLESGRLEPLKVVDDYDVMPLAEQGDVLVVRAKRTRGSDRTELWGLDSSTGERQWEHELQAEILLDVDSGIGEDWTYRLTPQGLVLLQLLEDPLQLVVQKINVATGQVVVDTTTDADDRHWTGVAWTGGTAYLTIRRLYGVDLLTGDVRPVWP